MRSTVSIPREPEQVMKQRDGSVLGKRTILKSDHFPGCQNKRLSPQVDGAPNYRKVSPFPSPDYLLYISTYLFTAFSSHFTLSQTPPLLLYCSTSSPPLFLFLSRQWKNINPIGLSFKSIFPWLFIYFCPIACSSSSVNIPPPPLNPPTLTSVPY